MSRNGDENHFETAHHQPCKHDKGFKIAIYEFSDNYDINGKNLMSLTLPHIAWKDLPGYNRNKNNKLIKLYNKKECMELDLPPVEIITKLILHEACWSGNYRVISHIPNSDINSEDSNSQTPLHIACEKGDKDIALLLLQRGLNVNALNYEKETPLHILSERYSSRIETYAEDDEELVDILSHFGAKTDTLNLSGETPLLISCKYETYHFIQILLDVNADLNIRNVNGDTPLSSCIDHSSHSTRNKMLCHSAKIILSNIALRQSMQQYINDSDINMIKSGYSLKKFKKKCDKEIAMSKDCYIRGTKINYYTILTDNKKLTKFLFNEAVSTRFENILSEHSKFPIYKPLMELRYNKALRRSIRLKVCFDFISFVLQGLPQRCIHRIIDFLTEKEVLIMVESILSGVYETGERSRYKFPKILNGRHVKYGILEEDVEALVHPPEFVFFGSSDEDSDGCSCIRKDSILGSVLKKLPRRLVVWCKFC